jgi:hypothetical protein
MEKRSNTKAAEILKVETMPESKLPWHAPSVFPLDAQNTQSGPSLCSTESCNVQSTVGMGIAS